MNDIATALASDPIQLVAGDGWGKTVVLRQAVYREPADSYPDGVAYVSGWGLAVEDIEQAIFEAFYESNLPDVRIKASQGQLRTSLADVHAAIVIDDLDVPRQHVDRIIDGCRECVFLSSASHQTLWSGGSVMDLSGLEPDHSVALFEQRLGRSLGTTEREAVALFAHAVAGYPMAIASAAAAVRRGGTVIDALRDIAQSSDPIAEVYTTISETLNLRESRLLSTLDALNDAPLPDGALAFAASVEEPVADLEGLVRDGILQVASPTYRLPSAAAVLLNLPDSTDSTIRGLTNWCHTEERAEVVASAGSAIVTAMRIAIREQDAEAAISLGRSADAGLAVSVRWGLWNDVLTEIRSASAMTGDAVSHAWSLHQLGTKALITGETDTGRQLLAEAQTIQESIGDVAGLRATQHNLAVVGQAAPVPIKPRPPAPKSGMSGWVWIMTIAAVIVIGGVIAWVMTRDDPATPPPETTVPIETGELRSSVPAIEFRDIPLEAQATAEIEVINTGPGPLDISSVRIEDETFFSSEDDCDSLAVSETCGIVVTFTANELGLAESALIIEHTGQNDSLRIELFGQAVQPPSAFPWPDTVNVDFGAVSQASDRVILSSLDDSEWSRTIEITNGGNVDVQIVDVALSSERFIQSTDCGLLGPNQSCMINVRFLASEPGPHNGVLLVEHTGDNPTIEIPITGIVLAPSNLTIDVLGSSGLVDSFVLDNDQQAKVRDQLDVVVLSNIEQVQTPDWLVAFVLDDAQLLQTPEWLDEFVLEEAQSQDSQIFWVFDVEVAITNSGEEPVSDEFFFYLEYRLQAELLPLWLPAIKPNDASPQFRVDTGIPPGEQVRFTVRIGVLKSAQQGPDPASIRALVDTCLDAEELPAPPCRIVESEEGDNISSKFDLPLVPLIE